jgi:uncharacterized phage protein gp47/JayE
MIPAPIILYPKTNWVSEGNQIYYSDALRQSISGYLPISNTPLNAFYIIKYRYKIDKENLSGTWSSEKNDNIIIGSTNNYVNSIPWSFYSDNIELEVGDIFTIEFKAYLINNAEGHVGEIIDYSTYSSIIVHIIKEEEINITVKPIAGLKIKRFNNYIKILIPKDNIIFDKDTSDFCGCNFYLSLSPGINYVLINDVPVTEPDDIEREEEVILNSSYTDSVTNMTITTKASIQVVKEYYTSIIDKTTIAKMIQQKKIPNIFLADGETLRNDIIYYIVGTVQIFNKVLNQLIESPYSEEIEAQFLKYTTDYQNLPKRARSDILYSISKELMLNNENVNVVPGSVFRDMIDPISLEIEKLYVIQDFIFACLSLDTLLKFDDENEDGISDSVLVNLRKKALANALGLKDPYNLQILIDEQFDKYASNYNITRKGATKATGTITFYTEIRPIEDIIISDRTVVSTSPDLSENRLTINFYVKGTKIINVSSIDNYYNPVLKRYEIQAEIEAVEAGESGNVPAGSITVALNVSPTLKVINNEPTRYGTNRETNRQLANRIKATRMSIDTGTEQGYIATAMNVSGVQEVKIEKAGSFLMMRDYDSSTKQHIGGKVDVYIKGRRIQQYVDQIAFNYEYPTNVTGTKVGEIFQVIDAIDFKLKCLNSKVNSENPIVIVNKIKNITRGKEYSLSNYRIINEGNVILLEKNFTNLMIGMATFDVIEVSYLYRSSNNFVLSNQPVEAITSVVTSRGMIIDPSKYKLVKMEDPLINGNSIIAKDAIKFFFNENDNFEIIQTTEEHDMLINEPARLTLKGVNYDTIKVTSLDDSIEFINNIDYNVILGSNTEYTYIALISTGKIRHGDRVKIYYEAVENFNVTYIVNDLVKEVQKQIDVMKHACADVITKNTIRNIVDISFTVVKKVGVDNNNLKSRIKTAISNYISSLYIGDILTQSAITNIVKNVEGVKDIKIPFIKMMKRNGSFISMDPVGHTSFEIYNKSSASGITSYRTLKSVLKYKTIEGGGDSNLFRGVYEDLKLLTLVNNPIEVSNGLGRAYIQSDGKIIVSTTDGKPPQDKYYHVSYYSFYSVNENIVQDITASSIEYLDIDEQSIVIEII